MRAEAERNEQAQLAKPELYAESLPYMGGFPKLGVIQGYIVDNGKENGNYYSGFSV